jgi:leucyl-tRNA synthetase
VKPWSTKGVEGVHRFLKRANRFVTESTLEDRAMNKAEAKAVAAMVKKVGEDLETMSFNTAIAAMMVFINETDDILKLQNGAIAKEAAEKFARLVEFHSVSTRDENGREMFTISALGLKEILHEEFGIPYDEIAKEITEGKV